MTCDGTTCVNKYFKYVNVKVRHKILFWKIVNLCLKTSYSLNLKKRKRFVKSLYTQKIFIQFEETFHVQFCLVQAAKFTCGIVSNFFETSCERDSNLTSSVSFNFIVVSLFRKRRFALNLVLLRKFSKFAIFYVYELDGIVPDDYRVRLTEVIFKSMIYQFYHKSSLFYYLYILCLIFM